MLGHHLYISFEKLSLKIVLYFLNFQNIWLVVYFQIRQGKKIKGLLFGVVQAFES